MCYADEEEKRDEEKTKKNLIKLGSLLVDIFGKHVKSGEIFKRKVMVSSSYKSYLSPNLIFENHF